MMRIMPYGTRAALVDLDTGDAVLGLHASVDGDPPAGTVELVPSARTLLVRFDPALTSFERLSADISRHSTAARPPRRGAELVVPVRYDGADLADVATESGISEQEVVRLHQNGTYFVAFGGFAPGFAYLIGLDPKLHLPRRATPRTRVPAGSVAIASEYTAIYPRESPGGWHLIGRTELPVWDVDRDPPNLLVPGTRVRFTEAPS